MNSAVKWIGGTTVVAAALLGSAVVFGNALEAGDAPPAARFELPPAEPAERIAVAAVTPAPAPAPTPAPFVIKSILPIEGAIRYGEWHWDESQGPATGPLVITIDLDARVMSVFRDGHEIGATAVLLGTDEYPTPVGVFPILAKERYNVSEIYNNAPMPWTMTLRLRPAAASISERAWILSSPSRSSARRSARQPIAGFSSSRLVSLAR